MSGWGTAAGARVRVLSSVLACFAVLGACGDAAGDPVGGAGGVGGTGAASGAGASHAGTGAIGGGAVGRDGGVGGARDGTGGSGDAGTGGDAGTDMQAPNRGDCKRGVAYGFDPASAPDDIAALSDGVTWFYGWSPSPSGSVSGAYVAQQVEFVPMVWGGQFDVDDLVGRIPDGARYLLGFNEPNFYSQANLTPEEAAALWPQLEEVADRRGLKLVSPALNYCGGGCNEEDPFAWLDRFFEACDGCRVDYIAAHWYACHLDALKWYVSQFDKYGLPIWLTEFSCGDEGAQPVEVQQAYMAAALDYLEQEPKVFRYAWFSARTKAIQNVDLLAGGGGARTVLGDDYVSLPAPPYCAGD